MEFWAYIDGYPNYQVSGLGRVRNVHTGRVLKSRPDGKGYLKVDLWVDGSAKTIRVHRLVAGAFVVNPTPSKRKEVDHENQINTDNVWTNLQWATTLENQRNKKISERVIERILELGNAGLSPREISLKIKNG